MADLRLDTMAHSPKAVRDFCKRNGYLPRICPCMGFWLLDKLPATGTSQTRRTSCDRLQHLLDLRLVYSNGVATLYRKRQRY